MQNTSKSGKKSDQDSTTVNPDSMSAILQIIQQQMDDCKHLEEQLHEEQSTMKERFTLCYKLRKQTSQLSNNAETNHTTPMAKQTLCPPMNITLLTRAPTMTELTSWHKLWHDYALINRTEQHDWATQLAAMRTHISQNFQTIIDESLTI